MKTHHFFNFLFLAALAFISCPQDLHCQTGNQEPLQNIVHASLDFAVQQSLQMAQSLNNISGVLPKTTDTAGHLQTCNSSWWTSGFFPGVLWYLYEYSGKEELKAWARTYSARVSDQQFTTNTHDVGFIIFCSFGNGFRITHDTVYREIIHTAAQSLYTRFHPLIGCIRSWDHADWNKQWQFPVIIDNMMNLELLMWTAKEYNEPQFSSAAISHANKTMKEHYRSNFSCFHVVSYDTLTGEPECKQTSQGYSHRSTWARGQAWGLYGFTMMYRYTKDTVYLSHANHIAQFLLRHPRLPKDKIPYWDFDTPDIPHAQRDGSAAAIMCSALLELSQYVEPKLAEEYLSGAETQLRTLSSFQYRNELGKDGNFILRHSVGNMPNKSEIDVPLIYADYYFVEALVRMKRLKGF